MRYDDYESAVLGNRGLRPQMTPGSVEDKYNSGGLYARVVDLPAEKAVERGFITDHATIVELGRLNVFVALSEALRWSHLYGGAALIAVTDDGPLEKPLNVEAITSVDSIKAYPLSDFSAAPERYTDPFSPKYGDPIYYYLQTRGSPITVHESRVIPVPGDPKPASLRKTSIPWEGRTGVTRSFIAIDNYIESLQLSKSILRRKQQAVYSMTGLADALQAGQGDPEVGAQMEATIQSRISKVDSARGVLNTVAIDREDTYDLKDMNVGGVPQVIQEFQTSISAETGIPITLLMGRSPAGLNATGAADFNTFYDMVRGDQRTKLTPALRRILEIIYAQPSVDSPNHWEKIEWVPVTSPTEEQVANVKKSRAESLAKTVDALTKALDAGLVTEEDAKRYLDIEGMTAEEGIE